MFAEEAYSPHSVLLMAVTVLCAVSGAFLLAVAGVKLYKRPLFWVAAATLLFPIVFSVTRVMLLIAPTQLIFEAYLKLQTVAGVASVVAPFLMLAVLIIRRHSANLVIATAVLSLLNIIGASVALKTEPLAALDFYPAVFYIVFCCLYIWRSKQLFPELAATPEALLKESNDLILVFDARERIMRASPNCVELFRIRDNMMLGEFRDILYETSTIHEDKTVSLVAASGMKYYQISESSVKTRGGAPLATVLMFFDMTEITELKAQLDRKNEELGALNAQLETYIKTSEKLEAEEQKEMAVHELEQAIGQKIEELTLKIEAADASQNLPGLIEACREIMAGVRQTVFRLTQTEEGEQKDD